MENTNACATANDVDVASKAIAAFSEGDAKIEEIVKEFNGSVTWGNTHLGKIGFTDGSYVIVTPQWVATQKAISGALFSEDVVKGIFSAELEEIPLSAVESEKLNELIGDVGNATAYAFLSYVEGTSTVLVTDAHESYLVSAMSVREFLDRKNHSSGYLSFCTSVPRSPSLRAALVFAEYKTIWPTGINRPSTAVGL